jgi:glutathione S-transferase
MSLTLYLHPLSSYCHKALIALYESSLPFEAKLVDLGNPAERDAFRKVWGLARFPVLHDASRSRTIPESTSIIEYLARHYPGPVKLLPEDPDLALQVRAADRFYDLHIHTPLQKIVGDMLRPADAHDPVGVSQAKAQIAIALGIAENEMVRSEWAAGEHFSLADCSAAPPLFFLNIMTPLAREFPRMSAYLDRMKARPSYARALREAQPYLHYFPGNP